LSLGFVRISGFGIGLAYATTELMDMTPRTENMTLGYERRRSDA